MDAFNFSHRKQAVDLFKLSVQTNPKNAKACLMAGKAIMQTIHKEESLPFFKKAYLLDKSVDEDLLFLIGQAYHYNEQFDSALWYYDTFNKLLSQSLQFSRVVKMNEVNWKIFECRNAAIYKAHPVGVKLEDLSTNINSEWPDYAPTISADESMMIFTTRRPDNNVNPSLADDLEYYEEIYMARKENGVWQKARKIDELNSAFHDASVSLSPDGKEMFVYSDENGGDIYETDLQGDGTWSAPKRLAGFINSSYLENSAAISADNKKLFFVSDRPDGYGGTDIYVALKNKRGEWSEVINLGPTINTPRDEEDVFVSANGQHLYFSSNGHAGMGDLDIYRSAFDSVSMKWSDPLNLGYPVNSVENDIYFVLTGDEKIAYISSLRTDSKGEQDIYRVDLSNWKPFTRDQLVETTTLPVQQVVNRSIAQSFSPPPKSAAVTDWRIHVRQSDGKPVDGIVTLADRQEKGMTMERLAAGDFQLRVVLPAQALYKLKVEAEGFDSFYGEYQIKSTSDTSLFEQTIFLTKKPPIALSNLSLFYESNKVVPQNQDVLDMIAAMMKENQALTIRISGHTDSNGDEKYNEVLSNQRSEQAKKFLVATGILPQRISVAAFGETQPLTTNATPAGRKFNRRTEIEFISN